LVNEVLLDNPLHLAYRGVSDGGLCVVLFVCLFSYIQDFRIGFNLLDQIHEDSLYFIDSLCPQLPFGGHFLQSNDGIEQFIKEDSALLVIKDVFQRLPLLRLSLFDTLGRGPFDVNNHFTVHFNMYNGLIITRMFKPDYLYYC